MNRRHLFTSAAGVRHDWEDLGGGEYAIHSTQEVEHILDRNKAMATHNDGYTPSREMRRVASIPLGLLYQWQAEEGWDPWDPANGHKLMQKLNDIDYLYLRTAPGRLGRYEDGFR